MTRKKIRKISYMHIYELRVGVKGALGRGSIFDRLPAGHSEAWMSVSTLIPTYLLNLSRRDSKCQSLGNGFS